MWYTQRSRSTQGVIVSMCVYLYVCMSLCIHVCVCAYTCVYVHTCVCIHMCERILSHWRNQCRPGVNTRIFHHFFSILFWASSGMWSSSLFWLDQVTREFLGSAYLHSPVLGFQVCAVVPGGDGMSYGNLNLGLHISTANALPIEPSAYTLSQKEFNFML